LRWTGSASLVPNRSNPAALKSTVGQPDIVEFFKATSAGKSFPDLERVVQSAVGRTGLMLFAEFELGAVLCRETGLETPKIIRFLVGNPLIMKEMVKHVPDAGSYAPVTVLIDERPDGCMSSEHFGQLAWQFKRVSGSSGLKVQAAIAC
jgi:uncharacterized protein (DUF302 family)